MKKKVVKIREEMIIIPKQDNKIYLYLRPPFLLCPVPYENKINLKLINNVKNLIKCQNF